MKIYLSNELKPREAKLIGKVLCVNSKEHNMHWEFVENKEYSLYEEQASSKIAEDNILIVLNEKSGYYRIYKFEEINNLKDNFFEFKLINH